MCSLFVRLLLGLYRSAPARARQLDNTELLSSLVGANATVAGAILELNNNSIYFNNTAIGGAVGSQVLTAANNKLSGNASPGANPSGNVTIK